MDWTQILTIAGINITMFAGFGTFLVWIMNKLDTDIKALGFQIESSNRRLDGHANRIDQLYNMYLSENKAQALRTEQIFLEQSKRTDQLYGMFVDLLKEKKA